MDLSKRIIARAGYTVLDWVSDIGGIQGMLISGVALFMGFWNHNMLENHLVSRLFKVERVREGKGSTISRDNEFFARYRFIKMMPTLSQSFVEYVKEMIPGWLCCSKCCKPGRYYAGFAKGRQKLQKESNIIEILKKLRYFEIALQELLTKQQ